ncbi:hypothetical protein RclHR1_06800001 [Rhizophagus clarus]|uniref:NrS-1 polymerase-like helicase domain-containing protein n=1 Tax=Rhizophagus clarus TaxID=94130 RepID=A0A2Z6SJJ6_9GLOM|nr:hypothetical protein RclHR1_06800001 [Rhizophagus clarus]
MSNQVVISKFGESKVAYSIDILKQLIKEANSLDDIIKAKRYICSYFILCSNPHGVFMWRPDIKNFEHIPMKNISMLIRPITKTFFKQSNSEHPPTKTEFNIAKWFIYDNSSTCVATCDPVKQRIYKIQGQLYLNIFPGFLHQLRPLTDFSANIHQAVKIIFTHIRDVWCSGDWNVTEYIIKWFAGMATGRKMYSILYLKSGQGWGKGIITDFIQRYVLGTQLVYKTSDPETILGSFNGQLLGKVLLLLEEMPTEKSQWNSLYRALKDKVTSDTIEIHEKYKTPTQYKNFMSTIVLTNENALRVENDDRRTVFLDISPARKGDLQYFKRLGDAMKYPGVGEAFYAYFKAIADKYPDFNGNPPPMTASKQEHIVSTLPPLFQFIKETYIAKADYTTTSLPVHILYATYTSYCENRRITPLSKVVVARTLSNELNITSERIYIDKNRTRVYNISRETLYKKYLSNNWIHETDEIDIEDIDIPKKSISDPKALDQFLAQIGADIPNKQKKSSPPVPPKPAHLKVEVSSDPTASEFENLIDGYLMELDNLISASAKPEQEPEVKEEPEIEPEPYGIPGSSKPIEPSTPQELPKQDLKSVQKANPDPMPKINTTKYWEWIDRHKYDHIKPWYKNSRDEMINELYSTAKECWAKYYEDDQYDWELLLAELEEFDKIIRRDNLYLVKFGDAIDKLKEWIKYNDEVNRHIKCVELADYLRKYIENKETVFVEPPSGYKVAKLQPQIIECHSK